MRWLKRIFVGNDPTESASSGPSEELVLRKTAKAPHFKGLVTLPDRLFRLMESHLQDSPEKNSRLGNDLMNARAFEKALPRLLAHATQTSNPTSLFLAGYCYKHVVTHAATTGTASEEHDSILSSGIRLIDTFLDLAENDNSLQRRGEPYSVRADLFLIKAQWDKDANALSSAKRDYEKAIELGSKDSSNLKVWKNNLNSVETVKRALF